MFTNKITRHHLLVFLALLFVSTICAAMVIVRIIYSDSPHFIFLNWNLFLAWLPFLFAWGAYLTAEPPTTQLTRPNMRWSVVRTAWQLSMGGLWLLFFPNAPYIVTDFMHLRQLGNVPIWYDAILLFAFALTGLFLGLLSLYFMQAMAAQRFGRVAGWGFVLVTVGLSSFGVYIGRFLRFNSWDALTNPFHLLQNIANHLDHPFLLIRSMTVSGLLSLLLLGTYVILLSLPLVALQAQND